VSRGRSHTPSAPNSPASDRDALCDDIARACHKLEKFSRKVHDIYRYGAEGAPMPQIDNIRANFAIFLEAVHALEVWDREHEEPA
jgi:hypothetical protein